MAFPGAVPAEILLVEDSEADIELTKLGLRKGRVANNLHVVMDGESALRFLRREEEYAEAPRPDLILLDLNLPRMSGREVLGIIREDEELTSIPVVILTTSEADADVLESYVNHANSYITKPVDFEKFAECMQEIADYWFTLVKLPNKDE